MPGRVEERTSIHDFIVSFMNDSASDDISTLYISGAPGTGKTALVNTLLRELDEEDIKVITINCMALNNVDALWDRLSEEFAVPKRRKVAGRPKKSLKGKEAVQGLMGDLSGKW